LFLISPANNGTPVVQRPPSPLQSLRAATVCINLGCVLSRRQEWASPLRRFGTVEELANLAAFLVSDGSGYINGEVVVMDGGEWLQGAGEFSALGRLLTEKEWEALKPGKKPSQS
jgi:NAD(P)-dependent dehydrogenase (short-subunit alcohol dehydrogenase family)